MNERNQLLAAIRQSPEEDTPRVIYADWLDENTESDHDTATAEFIRLSCNNKNRTKRDMPRKAYQWLVSNWFRLLPLNPEIKHRVFDDDLAKKPERFVEVSRRFNSGKRFSVVFQSSEHVGKTFARFSFIFYRGFLEKLTAQIPYIENGYSPTANYQRAFRRSLCWHVFFANPLCNCNPFEVFPRNQIDFDHLAALYRREYGHEFQRITADAVAVKSRKETIEFLMEDFTRLKNDTYQLLRIVREELVLH